VAHSLSAKKRIRQNLKQRARNRARKVELKDKIKGFTTALTGGDLDKAQAELGVVARALGRTVSKGSLHKKSASRKRSRLALRLNAVRATKAGGAGTSAAKA
jgi:small subunit ribosomal protein S20